MGFLVGENELHVSGHEGSAGFGHFNALVGLPVAAFKIAQYIKFLGHLHFVATALNVAFEPHAVILTRSLDVGVGIAGRRVPGAADFDDGLTFGTGHFGHIAVTGGFQHINH